MPINPNEASLPLRFSALHDQLILDTIDQPKNKCQGKLKALQDVMSSHLIKYRAQILDARRKFGEFPFEAQKNLQMFEQRNMQITDRLEKIYGPEPQESISGLTTDVLNTIPVDELISAIEHRNHEDF